METYPEIVSEKIFTEENKLLLDLEVRTEPGTTKKIVKKLNESIRIKGFRAGKVPKNVMEQFIGKEKLYVDKMVEQYNLIRDKKDYATCADPELIKWNEEDNGSLFFTIKAELIPEFEVKSDNYLGIEVEKDEFSGEKEALAYENYLLNLEKQFGSYKPVEREAQIGDNIVLNMEAFVEDKALPELTFKDKQIRLDERVFGKEITNLIVGTKADETKTSDVPLPDELIGTNAELKGKWAKITFSMDAIKELIPHPRNDELAKMTNYAQNLDDLKNKFSEEYTKNQTQIIDRTFEQNCIAKVLENINLIIPQSMITNEVKALVRYRFDMFEKMGLPGQQSFQGLDFNLLNEQAKNRLASALIFNKLCKQGDLKLDDISQADMDVAIVKKAEDNETTVEEETKKYENNRSKETLKKELLYDRFVKQIVDSAKPIARQSQKAETTTDVNVSESQ